jgi:branched-chain amino acid transport system substrate-binding protein
MAPVGKKPATSREEAGKGSGVRVTLTGRLRFEAGDHVLEEGSLPGRQARLVFAYLVAEHARPVPRDELAEAIWGETPPATWDKALVGIVSKVRTLLAECGLDDAITSAFGCYQLHLPHGSWLDLDSAAQAVAAADEAFRAGDLAAARTEAERGAALVRQPFLPGEDSHWVDAKRRELDALLVRALDRLTDASLAAGNPEEALRWAKELVAREPLREAGYQRLMRAYAAADNQAEALRAYEQCRRLLSEELGTHPSPATQAVHLDVLRGSNGDASPATDAGATPTVPAGSRLRRRRLAIAAVAIVGAAAAAAAALFATGGGSKTESLPTTSGSVSAIDPATNRITAAVGLPGAASSVAVGGGAVWVLNGDDGTIARIDPKLRKVVKTFTIGSTPTALASGPAGIWVGEGRAGVGSGLTGDVVTVGVARIDPRSNVVAQEVSLPRTVERGNHVSPQPLAVGDGAAWIAGPDGTLYKVDAATGRLSVVPRATALAVAGGDGAVWIDDGEHTVARVDPRSGRVRQQITLAARGLGAIAVGGGAVWVVDPYEGVLWRVVPGAQTVARTVDVGIRAGSVAFGEGAVWVANGFTGAVVRLDPRTGAVVRQISTGGVPETITAGGGSVWVTVNRSGGAQAAASGLTAGATALPASSCGAITYAGRDKLDFLIASDLPLQGPARASTLPMTDAIRFVLARHGFRAGRFTVGYQSCDDSTAQAGDYVFGKCRANAKAYAGDVDLLGLIGPYNSDCAFAELPLLSRARAGPLAVISGQNTSPTLTHAVPGVRPGTLDVLYPQGRRNYARLIAPDDVQGAADAVLAQALGVRRVYVLRSSDNDGYGPTITGGFVPAARKLGLQVVGTAAWNQSASSFERLVAAVARRRPDGVFLGGYQPDGVGALLRELRLRLGPGVKIIASDGFTSFTHLQHEAGRAAVGVYVSYPGRPNESLPAPGRRFVRSFAAVEPAGIVVSYAAVYAAEATEVLLDAIARSDGTRASVTNALLAGRVRGGILGDFHFDAEGDIDPSPVTIFRVVRGPQRSLTHLPDFDGGVVDRVVSVPLALMR